MTKIFRTQFCKSYFLYYYGRCVYFLNLKKNIAINNVIFGEGFLTALWGQNLILFEDRIILLSTAEIMPQISWNFFFFFFYKLKFNIAFYLIILGEGVLIVLVNCLTLKQSMQRVQSFREMVFISTFVSEIFLTQDCGVFLLLLWFKDCETFQILD